MSGYVLAWCVVAIFGIAGLFGAERLMRGLAWSLRAPLLGGLFVFFVAPAPVPRYAGEYAPAFVVAIFEFLFQIDGQPQTAAGILLIGIVIACFFSWLVARLVSRRKG